MISDLLKLFKRGLGGGTISKEHRDYILCKDVYHCTPSQLEGQEEWVLQLHYQFYMEEKKHEHKQYKRMEQKSKLSRK